MAGQSAGRRRRAGRAVATALCAAWLSYGAALADPPGAAAPPEPKKMETLDQAMCRLIERSAHDNGLPVAFLTRLVWRESSFRAAVTSPAGAQGVAQFMPQTAAERGLADPLDPEQAIPQAARLLAELRQRFGNLGLAAAAYNAGPNRVAKWRAAEADLPTETRAYVFAVTERPVDDWAAAVAANAAAPPPAMPGACLQLTASLRRFERNDLVPGGPFAPWDVQLAGNFSKALALISYDRARLKFAARLGDIRPMIIGSRVRSRGARAFYRVGLPADTRSAADALCSSIRALGANCVVYRR